ncbi:MAG: hypothetical protein ABIJ27_03885, partial [Candidatus Omnitrophota bacterium]
EFLLRDALMSGFRQMKERLRVRINKDVILINSDDDIAAIIAGEIAEGRGLRKVVVLDNGEFAETLEQATIPNVSPGEDYCVVNAKLEPLDSLTVQMLSLDAFVLAGIGVLYNDLDLIDLAYRILTGNVAPKRILDQIKEKKARAWWIILIVPRAVAFDADTIENCNKLRKIFSTAA